VSLVGVLDAKCHTQPFNAMEYHYFVVWFDDCQEWEWGWLFTKYEDSCFRGACRLRSKHAIKDLLGEARPQHMVAILSQHAAGFGEWSLIAGSWKVEVVGGGVMV